MVEDTLGLGFEGTPEISSWPRLEQLGLPIDSDEQRVTKKVKNRGESPLGGLEWKTDAGDTGDVCMIDENREGGDKIVDGIPPRDGTQQPSEAKSYAAATSGLPARQGNARLMPSMDDVVVLDEDEHCGNPESVEDANNNQGHCSFPLASKQVDKVSSDELFSSWMVVEDRRRRTRRFGNAGKSTTKEVSGSRFDILHNRHELQAKGGQGVKPTQKQHEGISSQDTSSAMISGPKVAAMLPGRVPMVITKGNASSIVRHQAVTIVEEGDGRKGGNGSVSRAGSKGFGKKKVQFKKKSDIGIADRVLPSDWSHMINVCGDPPRPREAIGDEIGLRVEPPDDQLHHVEPPAGGQGATDMVQSDEDQDSVLIVE
ncbi:hypothetical protein V6N13_043003 [Hibiscus sabdariffa]|uniref:Uncharacterized protein n=1 Tax=Hibiscus sabdariffa TaxID=183260 RepID=A0ABR2G2U7_9ROSI